MISLRFPLPALRYWMVVLASFGLTAAVVWNAFIQKEQFYPSIVYLSKSTISLAVIHIQAFVLVILVGKILCKLFFGRLRETEVEHLIEKGWYVLTETCLAFTVFRDDFTSKFVAMFTVLLLAKCFHWLLEDRIDLMERSLNISWLFHVRVVSLLVVLSLFDMTFIRTAYNITVARGASAQLVFGFEYSILLVSTWMISMKYLIHTIDLTTQNSIENKAAYFLYLELVANGIKVTIYSVFMFIMVAIHTFPLFAIRPMYLALKAFKKAAYDVIMSRRAIRYLNTMFRDADAAELTDNLCAVCREEMSSSLKKLPCNHVFHTHCLRSWFQRQQTCPTCRIDILRHESTLTMLNNNNNANNANERRQRAGLQNVFNRGAAAGTGANNAQGGTGGGATSGGPGAGSSSAQAARNLDSLGNLASMRAQALFMIPPPAFTPLPNLREVLNGLSEEELREMEGNQRKNVQARIECLSQIQILLDTAVTQMNQYSAIMSQLDSATTSTQSSKESKPSTSKHKSPDLKNPSSSQGASSSSQGAGDSQKSPAYKESPEAIPISIKKEPLSSTAAENLKPGTSKTVDSGVGSGDIKASDVDLGEDPTTTEELRRRRVEKLQSQISACKDSEKLHSQESATTTASSSSGQIESGKSQQLQSSSSVLDSDEIGLD